MALIETGPYSHVISELHPSKTSSQHDVNTKAFFDGLKKESHMAAVRMCAERAIKMKQILTHRWLLGNAGNGRWPRWDGSNGVPSQKSFSKWSVKPYKNDTFILHNSGTDIGRSGGTGFAYPQLLISGKGWPKRVKNGIHKKLVRGIDGGLYSTQMRNGLFPWLNQQRNLLKADLQQAFGEIT